MFFSISIIFCFISLVPTNIMFSPTFLSYMVSWKIALTQMSINYHKLQEEGGFMITINHKEKGVQVFKGVQTFKLLFPVASVYFGGSKALTRTWK